MSRVIFVNEAVNALYRVASSGELQNQVGATRAVLMRVGRRGALGPSAPFITSHQKRYQKAAGQRHQGQPTKRRPIFQRLPLPARGERGLKEKIFALSKSWEKHFPEASLGIKELSLPLHICICPRNLLGSPATIKRAYARLHLIWLLSQFP